MKKGLLAEKIVAGSANIAVLGLGYVGLPLALEFALKGYKVYGLDVDSTKVSMLRQGKSYVTDVWEEEIGKASTCEFSTDFSLLKYADAVSICVPTPLRKSREPDISYIVRAVDDIARCLHSPMLITLESTTFPGTTQEIIQPRLEQMGFKVGRDIFLCFSPERTDPANLTWRMSNTPKIIGGITDACTEMGKILYSQVTSNVVTVSSAKTAEMAKLLENTFRSVNIGLVNELSIMCERMGIDIWETIQAASTKPFGFMPFYPGPGIGGHCIPLDPVYLSWKARTYGFNTRIIDLATEVNSAMPEHVAQSVSKPLNIHRLPVRDSQILGLGVAYKRDVNDIRESPAVDVLRILHELGARVLYHDPHVPQVRTPGFWADSCELSADLLRSSDCVVLLTDHTSLDYDFISLHARAILDTRNAFASSSRNNVFRIGSPWINAGSYRAALQEAAVSTDTRDAT